MKTRLFQLVWLVLLWFAISGFMTAGEKSKEEFDILIRGALVFDGSGSDAFKADVAVRGDTIVKIAPKITGSAVREVNAQGLHLSPGFIDLHTHAERNMVFPEHGTALNYLKQGVTSLVVGQCGQSAWPILEKISDQIQRWETGGIGPNAALLAGHGTIRNIVMGMENRAPSSRELARMKSLVKEAMDQGASGMSSGLIYRPGRYAETKELVELVKVLAPYGGIYHTHIRNERDLTLDAVREAIDISRRAGVRAHISHIKVMGKTNWGTARDICSVIEEARIGGLRITADQYPFRFANGNPYRSMIPSDVWRGSQPAEGLSSGDVRFIFEHLDRQELIDLYRKVTPHLPVTERHLSFLEEMPMDRLAVFVGEMLVPTGFFHGPENSRERRLFLARYQDGKEKTEILQAVQTYIDKLVGFDNFIVGICRDKRLEGKSLAESADILGISSAEAAVELELMGAKCIPMQMQDDDIVYFMNRDYVGTGSDGVCYHFGVGPAHVRAYSTFTHKLRHYALERKVVPVPHVIRSQTRLPAEIMNWPDRGRIQAGCKADIVIFDLKGLNTPADISNPHQYSEGIKYLLINGEITLDEGAYTGALPGRVLRLSQLGTDQDK